PAYLGVGYIIGLRLASIQFAGGVLAWGLMVPLMIFFLGPQLKEFLPADTPDNWAAIAAAVWRFIVRPIAVGGMLVGAAYTLYKMRASLTRGLGKAFSELRQGAEDQAQQVRTEQYMSSKTVLSLIALMFVLMCFLYINISGLKLPAILAAVVMLIVGFFFATVSGSLCGFIGSSNNPVSGLTLSTLLIAALLMFFLGVSGTSGSGVLGGGMALPLAGVRIFFGYAVILRKGGRPLVVPVGMVSAVESTLGHLGGGGVRLLGDWLAKRRGFNEAQMTRVDNAG